MKIKLSDGVSIDSKKLSEFFNRDRELQTEEDFKNCLIINDDLLEWLEDNIDQDEGVFEFKLDTEIIDGEITLTVSCYVDIIDEDKATLFKLVWG